MIGKRKGKRPDDVIVQVPTAQLGKAPVGYAELVSDLKERIRSAQVRAGLSVNREMILLYWEIGREILARQQQEGWGTKVIDHLSRDLSREFPEMKGFSPRNLKYIRAFSEAYQDGQFVQQLVAQIPWGHNVRILDRIKNPAEREWYVRQTIQHGWSRNVLVHQLEIGLYKRQGNAPSNFDRTLPAPQSELARQILKDPYIFDFLDIAEEYKERELEKALLVQIRAFLLELGVGFSFVGSQYHLEVGDKDFYIDLLFYHLHLRCFVVIDLKVGEFEPEYAGKMNFYLSAVDDLLRHKDDQPSIGIILCKSKNKVIVEYALRDAKKPIGVSGYKLTETLPKKLKKELPSRQDIETEMGGNNKK
jgi:predicted nuclease of restriction endonuclease-like (RecB) superfamily